MYFSRGKVGKLLNDNGRILFLHYFLNSRNLVVFRMFSFPGERCNDSWISERLRKEKKLKNNQMLIIHKLINYKCLGSLPLFYHALTTELRSRLPVAEILIYYQDIARRTHRTMDIIPTIRFSSIEGTFCWIASARKGFSKRVLLLLHVYLRAHACNVAVVAHARARAWLPQLEPGICRSNLEKKGGTRKANEGPPAQPCLRPCNRQPGQQPR